MSNGLRGQPEMKAFVETCVACLLVGKDFYEECGRGIPRPHSFSVIDSTPLVRLTHLLRTSSRMTPHCSSERKLHGARYVN